MKNRKLVLTERLAANAKPAGKEYNLHDVALQGFALRVQPSGAKSWIMRRRVNGSPRRITLGDAQRMPLDHAVPWRMLCFPMAPRSSPDRTATDPALLRSRKTM